MNNKFKTEAYKIAINLINHNDLVDDKNIRILDELISQAEKLGVDMNLIKGLRLKIEIRYFFKKLEIKYDLQIVKKCEILFNQIESLRKEFDIDTDIKKEEKLFLKYKDNNL